MSSCLQVAGKREPEQEAEAQQWIETVLGARFPPGKSALTNKGLAYDIIRASHRQCNCSASIYLLPTNSRLSILSVRIPPFDSRLVYTLRGGYETAVARTLDS